jgi:acylphosphatase
VDTVCLVHDYNTSGRSFAVKKADGLGITGYAKNCDDGTVSGEAQGSESALDKFLQHLKMGPSAARVSNLDHKEIEAKTSDKGFERFVSSMRGPSEYCSGGSKSLTVSRL